MQPDTHRVPGTEELPVQVWVMTPTGELEWANDAGLDPEAIHPDDAPAFMQSLHASLASGEPLTHQVRMRSPDGEHRWVEVRTWPLRRDRGAIVYWVGIATDIESRARREALLDAVESPDSPIALLLLDPDFRLLSVNLPRGFRFPAAPWTEGRRWVDADPEVYEQVRPAHARILQGGGPEVVEMTRTVDDEQLHRVLLFYPVRIRGELIGVGIADVDSTSRKRAEIAAAQLAEERRALLEALVGAGERERRKIAADMHGDTLQVLGALRLKLDVLGATLDAPEQQAALDGVVETFELATARLRALLFELWPPSLERTGLAETISELLASSERDGLRTHLDVDLRTKLPLELRGVIYRVIAEALMNVRRHARATAVEVRLEEGDASVHARIRDDGVGFDSSVARFGHVGLAEMSDRVHAVGGEIEIRSAPGEGAEIRFSVPVRPRPPDPPPAAPSRPAID